MMEDEDAEFCSLRIRTNSRFREKERLAQKPSRWRPGDYVQAASFDFDEWKWGSRQFLRNYSHLRGFLWLDYEHRRLSVTWDRHLNPNLESNSRIDRKFINLAWQASYCRDHPIKSLGAIHYTLYRIRYWWSLWTVPMIIKPRNNLVEKDLRENPTQTIFSLLTITKLQLIVVVWTFLWKEISTKK